MTSPLAATVIRTLKRGIYATPIGMMLVPRYRYMFNPAELAFICRTLRKVAPGGGPVGEIGCFRGETTLFLNRFLDNLGSSTSYFAFDTFDGFTREDISYETDARGKNASTLIAGFSVNSQESFDETMRRNKHARVQSRRVDANVHDFRELDGACFCLVDVDLYRPVAAALRSIYPRMRPGGVIVVDDCRSETHHYDGAYQAYVEFIEKQRLPNNIQFGKLGVIEKRA